MQKKDRDGLNVKTYNVGEVEIGVGTKLHIEVRTGEDGMIMMSAKIKQGDRLLLSGETSIRSVISFSKEVGLKDELVVYEAVLSCHATTKY